MLRSRTLEEKIEITQRFKQNWLPLLTAGKIRPIIDTVFPLAQAALADALLGKNPASKRAKPKVMSVLQELGVV